MYNARKQCPCEKVVDATKMVGFLGMLAVAGVVCAAGAAIGAVVDRIDEELQKTGNKK